MATLPVDEREVVFGVLLAPLGERPDDDAKVVPLRSEQILVTGRAAEILAPDKRAFAFKQAETVGEDGGRDALDGLAEFVEAGLAAK